MNETIAIHLSQDSQGCCHYWSHERDWLAGHYELPTVKSGGYTTLSDGRWIDRYERFRVYARLDGLVVWSRELMLHYCVKFGSQASVDFVRAMFYAVWLQGYEPVVVMAGERRPKDCAEYDRAMDQSNLWHTS